MSMRKYGQGEILPEADDIKVEASKQDKQEIIRDVVEEQKKADEEK